MAAHFLCLTTGGGIPIFYKTRGDLKQLPFAVTGSLNGVHMFASTHGVNLRSTTTADSKIVWKTYKDSLNLILVTHDDGASDSHLEHLLDYMFQAMVLLYGLENISNIKNLERFKREIKICVQLEDFILDMLERPSFAVLTHSAEIIASSENLVLQNYLDAFCEAAASPYGCLLVAGRVAVATKKWWELTPVELVLLIMLTESLSSCSSRDIPVFLPETSPDVPHRLLTFSLISGVEVCVLCGPTPTLTELEREIDRFWRSSLDSLRSIYRNKLRLLPQNFTLDPNIQGLLVVNTESHACLCTVQPHTPEVANRTVNTAEVNKRRKTLSAFYKQVTSHLWLPPLARKEDTGTEQNSNSNTETQGEENQSSSGHQSAGHLQEKLQHKVKDTYICGESHKCYAMEQGTRQIFVLYNRNIPTYAMRSVTRNTLQTLSKEKCAQI